MLGSLCHGKKKVKAEGEATDTQVSTTNETKAKESADSRANRSNQTDASSKRRRARKKEHTLESLAKEARVRAKAKNKILQQIEKLQLDYTNIE